MRALIEAIRSGVNLVGTNTKGFLCQWYHEGVWTYQHLTDHQFNIYFTPDRELHPDLPKMEAMCNGTNINSNFKELWFNTGDMIPAMVDGMTLGYYRSNGIRDWPFANQRTQLAPFFDLTVTIEEIIDYLRNGEDAPTWFAFEGTNPGDNFLRVDQVKSKDEYQATLQIAGKSFTLHYDPKLVLSIECETLAQYSQRHPEAGRSLALGARRSLGSLYPNSVSIYQPPKALTIMAELMDDPRYMSTYGHLPFPEFDIVTDTGNRIEFTYSRNVECVPLISGIINSSAYTLDGANEGILVVPDVILPSEYIMLSTKLYEAISAYLGSHDASSPENEIFLKSFLLAYF